jgi:hypothetical protein
MTRLYEATYKQWDHTGFVVPEIEHSESQYPAAELKPASWLPVVRYDKKVEEYTVIAAGKVVALDKQGYVVPAGLKLSFEAAGGSTILTYTANDVSEGTIDLTTGVSVTAATSYTQTEVTTALRARGLILATETARNFITDPIGYAKYSYWQWCGGDGWNPALFRKHNHSLQHQVAVGCDKVLEAPMVPAVETAETQGGGLAIADTAIAFGTAGWKSSTGIAATTRYASLVSAGDNVVAMVLNRLPAAKITLNTPITDSASTLASMTEVTSIAAVTGADYFYIDYDAGVIFLYESGGNAIPSGFSVANTITYYQYETSATGTQDIVQVIGDVKVGDFLTFDSNSNFVKFAPTIAAASGGSGGDAYSADPDYDTAADADISSQLESFVTDAQTRCIGQVLAIWEWPRSGLEKVMTQYQTLTNYERMPGTATTGLTDAQVQASAANHTAIINFLSR